MKTQIKLLTLLGVLGISLSASDRPRLGAELAFSSPTGTLKGAFSSSQGLGVNILAEWELERGHGLRWDIIGFTNYPETTVYSNGQAFQSSLSRLSSCFNYTYHLSKRPLGPYLLSGAGITCFAGRAPATGTRLPQRPEGSTLPAYTHYLASTSWQPAWLAGVGFDFNKVGGVTVRYHAIQFRGHTLGTIEAGINTKF